MIYLYKRILVIERGIDMLTNILITVALVVFLVSIIFIYNARGIVRNKKKLDNENNLVVGLKVIGYLGCILSLLSIYYLK
ncbi:hypothetical protein D3C76_811220 [compost metagenome]